MIPKWIARKRLTYDQKFHARPSIESEAGGYFRVQKSGPELE